MLPLLRQRNIALFYFLTICNNSFFIIGNWIFFWTRYMTYGQLGWVDAICFAFGMFAEIPTGAIADLLGKKKTMIASMVFSAAGCLAVALSTSLWQIWAGFMIMQVGWALYSGAAEALAFDSLKEKKLEGQFDHVISANSMVGTTTMLIATLSGIWMWEYFFRLPHLAWTVAYCIGVVACFFLKEPKVDTEKFSFQRYFAQLSAGAQQLLMPKLQPFAILFFLLLGGYFLYSFGLIKPAIAQGFGWGAREQGFVNAGLILFSALLTRAIPWMRTHLSDTQGLVGLTVLLAAGFLLATQVNSWWGIVPVLLITVAGNLSSPWVSVVLNREIESKYRATTLSTVAMFSKIPYVLTAVIAGGMIQNGQLHFFLWVVGLLMLSAVATNTVFSFNKRA
jgi:MFS family permease